MPDSQPTKSDLEEEFALLRGAVSEYPELRPIVENLPDEVPDPQRASGSDSDQPENLVVTPSGDLAYQSQQHEVAAVPSGAPGLEFRDRGGLQLNRWRLSLAEKREALQARQEIFQTRARDLNVQLKQGRIQPDAWFRRMRGEIRKLHLSAYGIGYSGKFDEMGLRDYGAVGNTVQRQYRYLQKWKTEIRSEGLDSFSLARLNDRAQKYGAASRESFEKGYGAEVGIDTSVLPAHPADATTECMTRCRCRWAIDILSKENGDFNCTWTLGDSEHCATCLNRAMEWVQLEVRGNELRSDPEPIFA